MANYVLHLDDIKVWVTNYVLFLNKDDWGKLNAFHCVNSSNNFHML